MRQKRAGEIRFGLFNGKGALMELRSLIKKAEMTHELTEEELTLLLSASEAEEEMAEAADRVRKEYVGDAVHLRGLIEFSSYCRRNCMYCGLRRENEIARRYRLSPEEILTLAKKAVDYGYHTVVLQSGEDMWFTVERLVPIIKQIKAMGVAVTLSIGERSREEYAAFREAGADRFLIRIETTDRELYERLDPGMSFDERCRCINDIKDLGYEVGTGCLIGLPGQSVESLARDILFFKSIDADMVGIGPLIPNPETPLGDVPIGDIGITRRMVSAIRLLLPEANIPATTAMETLLPHKGREIILRSGANVVMPNVTEGEAREKYALYPGKACVLDTPAHCRACMETRIKAIGRFVGEDAGFRKHRR